MRNVIFKFIFKDYCFITLLLQASDTFFDLLKLVLLDIEFFELDVKCTL